jgi:hypothetical protein
MSCLFQDDHLQNNGKEPRQKVCVGLAMTLVCRMGHLNYISGCHSFRSTQTLQKGPQRTFSAHYVLWASPNLQDMAFMKARLLLSTVRKAGFRLSDERDCPKLLAWHLLHKIGRLVAS